MKTQVQQTKKIAEKDKIWNISAYLAKAIFKEEIMSGIVRRIDELGRIVIPKELRRTMRIRDGEELEMNQVSDNEIIIKKFSQMQALQALAEGYSKVLFDLCGVQIMIVDKSKVLTHEGAKEENKEGELISNTLFTVLQERKQTMADKNIRITKNDSIHNDDVFVCPILAGGDLYGGIVAVGAITNDVKSNINVAGQCLASQLE